MATTSEKVRASLLRIPLYGAGLAALAGYGVMTGIVMAHTLDSAEAPTFSEQFATLCAALAALVGGVATTGLAGVDPKNPGQATTGSSFARPLLGGEVGRFIGIWSFTTMFLLTGIACIVVSVYDDAPADLLKAEAGVAIGLFGPAVGAYLKNP